ncbi:hypothetical protein [Metabacillus litoralis]|uniref:hypothetical protein n=1 Tax=Metabacillus litoralis TaxID=152268 RepID=UPI00203F92B0|nr:hypothetical protein [Metabacillus litoralis]MCM3163778.1 hypothetical protein [Metabacillus litoralis]MCM3409904.1 hypothetical protein [Metabacillus litoralis]
MEELLRSFMNHIDKKFEEINQRFEQIDQKFEKIDQRFEQIDQRFEQIDKRFEQIDKRFEQIDKRFNAVDGKLSNLTSEVKDVKTGLVRLERRQSALEENLNNFATESRSHFKKVEEELEQHRDAFKIYSSDLNRVKTDVDYLSSKTGIHDTKLNYIEKQLEL